MAGPLRRRCRGGEIALRLAQMMEDAALLLVQKVSVQVGQEWSGRSPLLHPKPDRNREVKPEASRCPVRFQVIGRRLKGDRADLLVVEADRDRAHVRSVMWCRLTSVVESWCSWRRPLPITRV